MSDPKDKDGHVDIAESLLGDWDWEDEPGRAAQVPPKPGAPSAASSSASHTKLPAQPAAPAQSAPKAPPRPASKLYQPPSTTAAQAAAKPADSKGDREEATPPRPLPTNDLLERARRSMPDPLSAPRRPAPEPAKPAAAAAPREPVRPARAALPDLSSDLSDSIGAEDGRTAALPKALLTQLSKASAPPPAAPPAAASSGGFDDLLLDFDEALAAADKAAAPSTKASAATTGAVSSDPKTAPKPSTGAMPMPKTLGAPTPERAPQSRPTANAMPAVMPKAATSTPKPSEGAGTTPAKPSFSLDKSPAAGGGVPRPGAAKAVHEPAVATRTGATAFGGSADAKTTPGTAPFDLPTRPAERLPEPATTPASQLNEEATKTAMPLADFAATLAATADASPEASPDRARPVAKSEPETFDLADVFGATPEPPPSPATHGVVTRPAERLPEPLTQPLHNVADVLLDDLLDPSPAADAFPAPAPAETPVPSPLPAAAPAGEVDDLLDGLGALSERPPQPAAPTARTGASVPKPAKLPTDDGFDDFLGELPPLSERPPRLASEAPPALNSHTAVTAPPPGDASFAGLLDELAPRPASLPPDEEVTNGAPATSARDADALAERVQQRSSTPPSRPASSVPPPPPAQQVAAAPQPIDDSFDDLLFDGLDGTSPGMAAKPTPPPSAPPGPPADVMAEGIGATATTTDDQSDEPEMAVGTSDTVDDDEFFASLEQEDAAAAAAETSAGAALRAPSAPPRAPSQAPRAASQPPEAQSDRGAEAALRTVRTRKPREERFSLLGTAPEHARARARLMLSLAERATGDARGRLLVAAAELFTDAGDDEAARQAHTHAREASPTSFDVLQMARGLAIRDGAFEDLSVTLLEESRIVGNAELAAALLERAADHANPAVREKLLDEAATLDGTRAAVHLRLAIEALVRGGHGEAERALVRAAEATLDLQARAALHATAARLAEARGDVAAAATLFGNALDGTTNLLDTLFGAVRCLLAAGKTEEAIQALTTYAPRLPGEALQSPARRLTAVLLSRVRNAPGEAARWLADSASALDARTRADAALAAGDVDAAADALATLARNESGSEQAMAWLELARLEAARGANAESADAVERASRADRKLAAVRATRELLSRRTGDEAFTRGGADDSALATAAKLAVARGPVEDERRALEGGAEQGEAAGTLAELALDCTAELGDVGALASGLAATTLSAPVHTQRAGALLALSDVAKRADQPALAAQALDAARAASPADLVVLRAIALDSVRDDASLSAWLDEASRAEGSRAAFAATRAALSLDVAAPEAIPLLKRVIEARPDHSPAIHELDRRARQLGDVETLGWLAKLRASRTKDPFTRAENLVRLALIAADQRPDEAREALERAAQDAPKDGVIADLLIRLHAQDAASERAARLVAAAAAADGPFARAYRARAAALLAADQRFDDARELYAALLSGSPDDALIGAALDSVDLARGDRAAVIARTHEAVERAVTDEQRATLLHRLAQLFELDVNDEPAARELLRRLVELSPNDLAGWRALERLLMRAPDTDPAVLADVERELVSKIDDPHDVHGPLRLAVRLYDAAAPDVAERLILEHGARLLSDPWFARTLETVGRKAEDARTVTTARLAQSDAARDAVERASQLTRAAAACEKADPREAIGILERALSLVPDHEVAIEALARMLLAHDSPALAADALERAARHAKARSRAVALFYEAGTTWERAGDEGRAVEAFREAARVDASYRDVYERLRVLLEQRNATAELIELTKHRVAVGGSSETVVALHLQNAELHLARRDLDGAREDLRAALAVDPNRLDALTKLAAVCSRADDWRGASDALIRVARLSKDPIELRDVFYKLGEIYDTKLPDAKRAEAALRRALKLDEKHVPSMQRLAMLYRRVGDGDQAAQVLASLADLEPDPDVQKRYRLEYAEALEQKGDVRGAEASLEQARKAAPGDIQILKKLADFYTRQNAQTALAMHLNRAVSDFRNAVLSSPKRHDAWTGLVHVLQWRARTDAARCCASAAAAMGVVDQDLAPLIDLHGGIPGAGGAAADADFDDMLSPSSLTPPTRTVLKLAADALEKALPFDAKAARAEKANLRDAGLKAQIDEIARWFGVESYELWTTSTIGRACIPLGRAPVSLLLGRDLIASPDERERLFAIVRAFKLAQSHLAITARIEPRVAGLALAALVRSVEPTYVATGYTPAELDDMSRRLQKHVSRKQREEMLPSLLEMGGSLAANPSAVAASAMELGDRVALLALGSVPAAITSLLRAAGDPATPITADAREAAIHHVPSAAAMLSFAVSDTFFEARRRAGADRR